MLRLLLVATFSVSLHHQKCLKYASDLSLGCLAALAPASVTCAAALAEEGLNPIADAACFASALNNIANPV